MVFESDHESGAHALINDHGIFDRKWDSHGGRVDELRVVGADVDDEAGAYWLLALVVLNNVFLDAFLKVPTELLANCQIETSVHQTIRVCR